MIGQILKNAFERRTAEISWKGTEVDGGQTAFTFISKVDGNGRQSILHRPPKGQIRTADANFFESGRRPTKSHGLIHITHNSSPDSLQKFGVYEYAAYYMRHVLTFKFFTGSKLYPWEVTHKLWVTSQRYDFGPVKHLKVITWRMLYAAYSCTPNFCEKSGAELCVIWIESGLAGRIWSASVRF